MSQARTTRYAIIEELGRGGMATVYLAYDEVAQMEVALKVIHEHLVTDEAMVEAFEREAALMQSVDHPGVVRVHGLTEIKGRTAIAMEVCPGGDLRRYLLGHGPLDEPEAVAFFDQLLDALAAIHDQGIVHRDIKPQNVMIGADGTLKLIDFGIGQAQALMEVDAAGQVGTVEYMAPERIDGLAVDGRSDLYSAAVMLFEMVCGHVPYRADAAAAVIRMHRQAPVPDPTLFAPALSNHLARTITRGLAKYPEERFHEARQMKAWLAGDDREHTAIDDHPRWTSLRRDFDARAWMAAPIADEGHEWILFSADRWDSDTGRLEAILEAVREMTERYQDHLTVEAPPRRLQKGRSPSLSERLWWTWRAFSLHPSQYTLLRGSYGAERSALGAGIDPSQRLTVARGLSRAGAEHLIDDFKQRHLTLRYARVPRAPREGTGRPLWLLHGVVGPVALSSAVYMLVFFLPFLLDPTVGVGLLWLAAGTIFWAMMAAAGTALLPTMLSRTSAHKPDSALFDFYLAQDQGRADSLVQLSHLQLTAEIQSPRIAASLARGLNLALHLRDLLAETGLDGDGRTTPLVEGLTAMGRRIIDLEHRVAALPPAQIASRLRRLDFQIAAEEDLATLDALMDQKQELRQRLEERDADQLILEGLAQQCLAITARLAQIVGAPPSPDQAISPADEPVLDLIEDLQGLALGATPLNPMTLRP